MQKNPQKLESKIKMNNMNKINKFNLTQSPNDSSSIKI